MSGIESATTSNSTSPIPPASHTLLRCTIFCKRTGVCLFEKIWQWPLQASPHDMAKMLLSFHQISGQLGCKSKDVNQVVFNVPQNTSVQSTSGRRRQRRIERTKTSSLISIRLVTIANEHVSIAIFHKNVSNKSTLALIDKYMEEMMDDFISKGLLDELLGLKDALTDIAAEKPNLSIDREDILNTFKTFDPVAEALRAKFGFDEPLLE